MMILTSVIHSSRKCVTDVPILNQSITILKNTIPLNCLKAYKVCHGPANWGLMLTSYSNLERRFKGVEINYLSIS